MNYYDIISIVTFILLITSGVSLYKLRLWKKKALDDEERVKYYSDALKDAGKISGSEIEHLNDTIKKRDSEINDLNNKLKKAEEKAEKNILEFTNEVEKAVEERTKEIEADAEESIGEIIKNIDTNIGNQLKELISNHTLHFQCACSKNPADKIPCYIDFTKENEFQCKRCGAKYRVEFRAYPVLITRTINESILAEEVQKQITDKFGSDE